MKKNDEASEKILELIRTTSPDTVEKLISLAQQELNLPRDKILSRIIELQDEGKITLSLKPKSTPTQLVDYTLSSSATWFWAVIVISALTMGAIFFIPENAFPAVFARYVLGSLFVLFLPGYSLIKTLFPLKEIDNIERVALSMGMSLALVPLIGLLLNYTPWGIRLAPISMSLLALTTILSITSLIREYQAKHQEQE